MGRTPGTPTGERRGTSASSSARAASTARPSPQTPLRNGPGLAIARSTPWSSEPVSLAPALFRSILAPAHQAFPSAACRHPERDFWAPVETLLRSILTDPLGV